MKRKNGHIIQKAVATLAMFALLVVSITFIPSSVEQVQAAPADATTRTYEEKIRKLEEEKKRLKQQISASENDKANAMQQKTYYDKLLATTQDKITLTNELLAELGNEITQKNEEIAAMEQNIEDQFNLFLDRLRMAQDQDTATMFQIVLGSGTLSEVIARMEEINSIMAYNKRVMEDYEANKQALEAAKAQLDERKAQQEKVKAELVHEQNEAQALIRKMDGMINEISQDQAALRAEYEKAEREKERLDKELEAYLRELQAQQNKPAVTGAYMWPVSRTYISSYFGARPDPFGSGATRKHGGLDIPAGGGTPIWASKAGTVVRAEYNRSYGYYVLLDHGGGYATLYAHCSALKVSAGEEVKQGQTIALVGTTGSSTGNHLHFEVRVNGTRVDPLKFVSPS